ncbi:MAG: glucosidase, partial [Kofleriaceae bacterium]
MSEQERMAEDARRVRNWRRWGPYLSDRQWGTVREDYSESGDCWTYLPHDHARSRAYRWGEDGLLGICDRECRLCFSVALWNGHDPILKERLFGLSGPEGNHGEDVKELYYFLEATPTCSYLKALYKYPHAAYPYTQLLDENRRRGKHDPEFELEDTGVFDHGYWDVFVEYAKAGPDDLLIELTVANRGDRHQTLHLLPQLWLRNTWSWGRHGEGYDRMGSLDRISPTAVRATQPTLGNFRLDLETAGELLFTDNETNFARLYGSPSPRYTKDAFHRRVVGGEGAAVNPAHTGTKCAAWYALDVAPGEQQVVRLRLSADNAAVSHPFADFSEIMAARRVEAEHYHRAVRTAPMTEEERTVVRQADAGLVWSRKFYHYIVEHWQDGDPSQPPPSPARKRGRNRGWEQLWARDVISMPDGWEYPWFAAWDLAFHCVAQARFDPEFAKHQLLLLMREWYVHPNGQLPAYEFAFGDVNPPVHAWAVWRIYQLAGEAGHGYDREF